jgi:hypothetical protein
MFNSITILFLFIVPLNVYGIDCWCQQGPSSYNDFLSVTNPNSQSIYTSCYFIGSNPTTDTCYSASCPSGDWIRGDYYPDANEVYISASSGDDCIAQCSALGNEYNIAAMYATCGNNDDDIILGSCNVLTCPNIWDGHCGAFNKPTSKWCDYDGTGSDANICCAEDFSECCESDGAAIGGTIGGGLAFLIVCVWYCRRRRDNTNEDPPNFIYKCVCPPCAVLGYQGCENKTDSCMSCCLCSLFTLCCWEPKKVIINNEPPDNIQYVTDIELQDDK